MPPKFKHKRAPRGPPSPPETIMRSPSRKITAKDQADWNIPSCISQWKNAKGYTIPLHMRIQSDGRNLQDTTVNHKFPKFSEAILLAEIQARKEVEERNKIKQSHHMLMEIRKEKQIQKDATLARAEKNKIIASNISQLKSERRDKFDDEATSGKKRGIEDREREEAKRERDALRRQARKDVVRQRRLEVAGKQDKANPRDGERDISEKIALGQAQPSSKETMFDQRLFNQNQGLESGFGEEDDYNLYDKPLFADRTATNIYKSTKEVNDDDIEDESKNSVSKVLKSGKPDRGFEGTDYTKGPRAAPVEFEQKNDSTDVSNLKAGLQSSHKRAKYDD
jgi:SNW domain-containing protein 1